MSGETIFCGVAAGALLAEAIISRLKARALRRRVRFLEDRYDARFGAWWL